MLKMKEILIAVFIMLIAFTIPIGLISIGVLVGTFVFGWGLGGCAILSFGLIITFSLIFSYTTKVKCHYCGKELRDIHSRLVTYDYMMYWNVCKECYKERFGY